MTTFARFSAISLLPDLCSQWQFVELGAGLTPAGVMLFKDGDEAITVRGLDQMSHFMHDDVLQQILRLFTSSVLRRMFPE